jgi:hypothetical protein
MSASSRSPLYASSCSHQCASMNAQGPSCMAQIALVCTKMHQNDGVVECLPHEIVRDESEERSYDFSYYLLSLYLYRSHCSA